MTTFFTEYVKQ